MPLAVIDELMDDVFPDAEFTQIADTPGAEAFDFVDPIGVGDYVSTTPGGCTNVGITLRMGEAPGGGDTGEGGSAESVGEGSGAASGGDGASSGGETTTTTAAATEASITIVTTSGVFMPMPETCTVSADNVDIVATGDGDLTVSGSAENLTIAFIDPSGTVFMAEEPAFGILPGSMQFISSTGLLLDVSGCAG